MRPDVGSQPFVRRVLTDCSTDQDDQGNQIRQSPCSWNELTLAHLGFELRLVGNWWIVSLPFALDHRVARRLLVLGRMDQGYQKKACHLDENYNPMASSTLLKSPRFIKSDFKQSVKVSLVLSFSASSPEPIGRDKVTQVSVKAAVRFCF